MRHGLTALAFSFSLHQFAYASTSSGLGVASDQLYNRPEESGSETTKIERVRIPVTVKAWNEVDTKAVDGSLRKSRIAGQPVSQVLRARIERANDFYIGDWRITTTPVRWLKRSNQYQVRIEAFRRLGESGQIEESLGSITLTGSLEKQGDALYILNGRGRRLFRDNMGNPLLDLEAGQHNPKAGPALSKLEN